MKMLLTIALAAAGLLLTSPARATLIGVHSSSDLPYDDMLDWAQYRSMWANGAMIPFDDGMTFVTNNGVTGSLHPQAPRVTGIQPLGFYLAGSPPVDVSDVDYFTPSLIDLAFKGNITFNFDTPVMGVGAYFNTSSSGGYYATATVNGETFTSGGGRIWGQPGITAFVGVISDKADITSATFRVPGTSQPTSMMYELRVIDAPTGSSTGPDTSAAPEPATWFMMVGGFGLVGQALRRRKSFSRTANA